MPFKHAHPIDLTAGDVHHVDFSGQRFGRERHEAASKVPGVEPGTIVAHTHHDVDERVHEETGMTSHHITKVSPVSTITAPFDADAFDEPAQEKALVEAAPKAAPAGRRNLDRE